jgi:hypothetical protein
VALEIPLGSLSREIAAVPLKPSTSNPITKPGELA